MCVGSTVATAHRDIALRPTGDRWTVPNAATGIAALVGRLQAVHPTLMVLDATGGSHRAGVAARAAAVVPLVGVHPRQVRDVAKATGQLAKPDALAARAVAHVAEAVRPALRPRPDAQTEALRALLARRRHRIALRTAAQHRLENASPRLRADLVAPIAWLDQPVAPLDDDLDTTRRASPVGREREPLSRRVPGIGPRCARTLPLDLPAGGT
jgi:transposase